MFPTMDYRSYRVWPKAYNLTRGVYEITRRFPPDERYGLTAQMRRAAISVSSNFAEGMGRSGDRDKARFIYIAIGSANELEVQLDLSRDFGYVNVGDYKDIVKELQNVRGMLSGLAQTLVRVAGSG